jgi:hypothetical protein
MFDRVADNHTGYCVEWYGPDGWEAISKIYKERVEACNSLAAYMAETCSKKEFRVYEAIDAQWRRPKGKFNGK